MTCKGQLPAFSNRALISDRAHVSFPRVDFAVSDNPGCSEGFAVRDIQIAPSHRKAVVRMADDQRFRESRLGDSDCRFRNEAMLAGEAQQLLGKMTAPERLEPTPPDNITG